MITQKRIPDKFVTDSIRWLGVEKADGGFYLYQYEDESKPCKWDAFYGDLNDLIEDCKAWGLTQNEWPELRMLE